MTNDDEPVWTALRLSPSDNVATSLRDMPSGAKPRLTDCDAPRLLSDIARGHKFSLTKIAAGSDVLKYGQPVGVALTDIMPGEHVHLHNIEGLAGRAERHGNSS